MVRAIILAISASALGASDLEATIHSLHGNPVEVRYGSQILEIHLKAGESQKPAKSRSWRSKVLKHKSSGGLRSVATANTARVSRVVISQDLPLYRFTKNLI